MGGEGLASLQFAGQANSLRTLARVDIVGLSPKAVWRRNFFLQGPQSFLIRPSADYTWPTHVIEDNTLRSVSTDLNVNHTFKRPSR